VSELRSVDQNVLLVIVCSTAAGLCRSEFCVIFMLQGDVAHLTAKIKGGVKRGLVLR